MESVFVIVFIFASDGFLRGNGAFSRPETFGDGDDIAILMSSWDVLSRDLNPPDLLKISTSETSQKSENLGKNGE
jgi:hypothetical protein